MRRRLPALALSAALAALACTSGPCASPAQAGWFGPNVDPQLVAQVPFDKRGAINAADAELAVASEDLTLAKMKQELADTQRDYASLGVAMAKAQEQSAKLALDIAMLEAVMAQGLGKPDENTKLLNDLKADRIKSEGERLQLQGKQSGTDLMVRDMQQRVAAKEQDVAALKARMGTPGAPANSSAPSTPITPGSPAKAQAPKAEVYDKPTVGTGAEVISEKPSPEAAPAISATPEGDLKN